MSECSDSPAGNASTSVQERIIFPTGNGPYNPCPWGWLQSHSPGELHGVLFRQILRERAEAANDDREIMNRAISRLEKSGTIDRWEGSVLRDLVNIAVSRADDNDVMQEVAGLHQRLLDSDRQNPVASTVSGVALDSLHNQRSPNESGKPRKKGIWKADLRGALEGAAIGAGFGLQGAVIGGVLFGAASSIAEAYD